MARRRVRCRVGREGRVDRMVGGNMDVFCGPVGWFEDGSLRVAIKG